MRWGQLAAVILIALTSTAAGTIGVGAVTSSVHVIRQNGLLPLPRIDVTIHDPAVVDRLANDITGLPLAPGSIVNCPEDFGTSYTLTFSMPGQSAWKAVVDAQGCRFVQLSNGPTRSAAQGPLFTDLGNALGLALADVNPDPCPGGQTDGSCYHGIRVPSTGTALSWWWAAALWAGGVPLLLAAGGRRLWSRGRLCLTPGRPDSKSCM